MNKSFLVLFFKKEHSFFAGEDKEGSKHFFFEKKKQKTFFSLALGLLLAACAKGQVQTTEFNPAAGPLPAPRRVVVTDFAVSPGDVRLDTGVAADLQRDITGETKPQAVLAAERSAQAALRDTLIKRLTAYGLPVEYLPRGAVPPRFSLLVQGQIVSVNEGNRTRRLLIGLGAGRSSVTADAQLYYIRNPSAPEFLQSYAGSANSGRMPGAAETMGVGAATDRLAETAAVSAAAHTGVEIYGTSDAANAGKLADALARQIGRYAVMQGWLPPGAVQ